MQNMEWKIYLKPVTEDYYTINIPAAVAHDTAGKDNEAAEELKFRFDKTPPVFTLSTDSPSFINVNTFTVEIESSEEIIGFTQTDISVTNATKLNFETITTGRKWSIDIRINSEGEASVYIDIEKAQDLAGNLSAASNVISITYDITPPTVSDLIVDDVTFNSADISFNVDEAGTYYFVLVYDTSLVPTVENVLNGTGYNGNAAVNSGNATSLITTANELFIEGLNFNTNYVLYLIALDALNNSTDLNYVQFTTMDVGIQGIDLSGINIYPNPSEGIFVVDLNNFFAIGNSIKLSVTNNKGEIILVKDATDEKVEFDLSNYASGIYYILIQHGNTYLNVPLMIK